VRCLIGPGPVQAETAWRVQHRHSLATRQKSEVIENFIGGTRHLHLLMAFSAASQQREDEPTADFRLRPIERLAGVPSGGRHMLHADVLGGAPPPRVIFTGCASGGGEGVAIYRLLRDGPFDREAVTAMTAAYEEALRKLGLVDRTDPVTELIAGKIIACARTGERNPTRLCETALKDATTWSRPDPNSTTSQAQEYRERAAQCAAIAERMSLHDDRRRLLAMAQQWLDLADKSD